MDLPYLVLKNILEEHSDAGDFLLALLSYDKGKKKPQNKILYDKFNKVFNYFSHLNKESWISTLLKLTKYFLKKSPWQFTIVITAENKISKNIVFQNEQLTIVRQDNKIQWIVVDENLLAGSKYLENGKVLNKSLEHQFNKIAQKIINII
jgi:hypothetical protein